MIEWFPRWPKNCSAVTLGPHLESDPPLWPPFAAGALLSPSLEYIRLAWFSVTLQWLFLLDYTSSGWETCSFLMTPVPAAPAAAVGFSVSQSQLGYVPDGSDLRWAIVPEQRSTWVPISGPGLGLLWVVWLTDGGSRVILIGPILSSCCAAMNSDSIRPDASLPLHSGAHLCFCLLVFEPSIQKKYKLSAASLTSTRAFSLPASVSVCPCLTDWSLLIN